MAFLRNANTNEYHVQSGKTRRVAEVWQAQ
jgi:hypothetical protein